MKQILGLSLDACVDYRPTNDAAALCGFDKPDAVITVKYTGEGNTDGTLTLTVGDRVLDGDGRYVRMDVTVRRDGKKYTLHFEKGENIGGLHDEPTDRGKKTGTVIRWLPDLDVFTDTAIPAEYFTDVMKRQAVVNAGVTFRFRNEAIPGHFETEDFVYQNGIVDYVTELAGEGSLTVPVFWEAERKGRDRADKPEYKVKLSAACCFSNRVNMSSG